MVSPNHRGGCKILKQLNYNLASNRIGAKL